jgi:DNA-binding response OmpR family regulator
MSNNSSKETILIVDDNPQGLNIIGEILKPYYRRQVARSGEKALAIAASDLQPDLILLDIMMPGLDGYEVCQRLKADERTKDIPVIFITAKDKIEDEAKGLDMGAVDYITKPVKPPILLARVKTHLELKKAREDLQKQNEILKENVRLREDVDRITRHDLKTPLSGEQTEMLDMIEESGYKMLAMINLSLDLYKMETGKYKFDPVPVNLLAVVNKIFKEIRDDVEARELSVKVLVRGEPAKEQDVFLIQGDELLCYSMLSNIIKNAVEASPTGEEVEVAMIAEESAVIGIHNVGSVPIDIRGTFFDKYTTSGKSGGTGLGTYSAKLIAQTLGGNIKLETSDEAGTTITIKLPKY